MQYNLLSIGSEIQLPLFVSVFVFFKGPNFNVKINHKSAGIAQLGERQTEDLNVPGSMPGFGNLCISFIMQNLFYSGFSKNMLVKKPKKTNTSDALLY